MKRYAERFAALRAEGRAAFIPFTMLGFPEPAACADHLELLARHADALELGVPFSDPVADGPTIQRAAVSALRAGADLAVCLDLVRGVRSRYPDLPIGLLVYANPVVRAGLEVFYARAAAAGVDSVLVADVPGEEGAPYAEAARAAGVAPVFIAAPNTGFEALDRIATLGAGYTYVLTRAGITGAEQAAGTPADALLAALVELGAPPPVLGFGISRPDQVAAGVRAGAVGVISGSAVIDRLSGLYAGTHSPDACEAWLETMRGAAFGGHFKKM